MERLADRDGRILGRVMLVDVEVAFDLADQVDRRVAAELLDHVVEETDPGGDLVLARPVEVELDEDVGFVRFAGDPAGAHGLRPRPG